mgnify:CR=1 FL=1
MTERRRERPDDYFADWKEREALAEGMIPLIGKLYRANNVKTYIYGKNLVTFRFWILCKRTALCVR